MSVTLEKMGKLDEAIASLEIAVSLDPLDVLAHNNLGLYLKKKGNYEEAIKHLQAAIHIDPDFLGPYENLIILYRLKGDNEKVKEIKNGIAKIKKQEVKKPPDFYRLKVQ